MNSQLTPPNFQWGFPHFHKHGSTKWRAENISVAVNYSKTWLLVYCGVLQDVTRSSKFKVIIQIERCTRHHTQTQTTQSYHTQWADVWKFPAQSWHQGVCMRTSVSWKVSKDADLSLLTLTNWVNYKGEGISFDLPKHGTTNFLYSHRHPLPERK